MDLRDPDLLSVWRASMAFSLAGTITGEGTPKGDEQRDH